MENDRIRILLERQEQILAEVRKDLVVQQEAIFPKQVQLPMDPPAWRKAQVIFHNLGNLLRPLELTPASRERVVPQNGKSAQFLEIACQEQK